MKMVFAFLRKKKNLKVNKKKIWNYNFMMFNLVKILKKIKYRFFYKKN